MRGYVHVALALGCTVAVVWLSDLHPLQEIATLLAGAAIGVVGGRFDADALAARVDATGALDLYDEDVIGFIVPVAILASAPFAFGSALALVSRSEALQSGLQGLICSLSAFWLLHDAVLGRRLRRLLVTREPFPIRRFYARSVVGPQALIGATGVVASAGERTFVRVHGELWAVQSSDIRPLVIGERVIVTDVDGLRVSVRRAGATD
jgi:membrane protein implicated in regulation of membrane protease activity